VPLISTQTFSGEVANLRRMNEQPVGNLKVTQILGDLSGLHHRASDQRNLAAILKSLIDGQLDAVDR
jgi:hypothetical protein